MNKVEGYCLDTDPDDGAPSIHPCQARRLTDTLFVSGDRTHSFGYDFFFHRLPANIQYQTWLQDYLNGLQVRVRDAQEELTRTTKLIDALKEMDE